MPLTVDAIGRRCLADSPVCVGGDIDAAGRGSVGRAGCGTGSFGLCGASMPRDAATEGDAIASACGDGRAGGRAC